MEDVVECRVNEQIYDIEGTNKMLFSYKIIVTETTRTILSVHHISADDANGDDDNLVTYTYEDHPREDCTRKSPLESLVPDDEKSWSRMEKRLLCMGVLIYDMVRDLKADIRKLIQDCRCCPSQTGKRVRIILRINKVSVRYGYDEPRLMPTDDSAIRGLKRTRVAELAHVLEDDVQCPICLEELVREEEKELTHLPCHHAFHGDCILEWLKTNHFCPVCRFELPEAKRRRQTCTVSRLGRIISDHAD